MSRKHAILSASAAKQWLSCTPSARASELLPETTSSYADEGTLAHDLAASMIAWRVGQFSEHKYKAELRRIKKSEYYNKEMHSYITEYANYVFTIWVEIKSADPSAEIYLETRLDYSRWVPDGFGTGDVVILSGACLYFIDLKYGKGVAVDSYDNPQLKLYALGAINEFEYLYPSIKEISMTIYQPRLNNISPWQVSYDDLMQWADGYLRERALLAYGGEGEFKAGEHCRFCKVKPRCKANLNLMKSVSDKYDFLNANLMTEDDIAEMLTVGSVIKSWITSVLEYAEHMAVSNGVKYPGYKLVEGRSNRKYTDPTAVQEALKKAGYKESDYIVKDLMPLAKLESLLTKPVFAKIVGQYVEKPSGAPALVPMSDKRSEWISRRSADWYFQDIETTDETEN